MTQQNTTAWQQTVDINTQLTQALHVADQLRRQRADLEKRIDAHELNLAALQNIAAGVELGKRAAAEAVEAARAADAKKAAEESQKANPLDLLPDEN